MQTPDVLASAKSFAVMFTVMVGAFMSAAKLNRWMEKRKGAQKPQPELFPNGSKDEIVRQVNSLKARMLASEIAADEFRTETRAFQRDISERLQAKGI